MNNFIIEPQDLAMDSFRRAFPIPLPTHVVKNGKLMRFRLSSDRRAAEYFLRASSIIEQLDLPLTPEVVEWKVSGVVFDRFLEIQFDSSKLIPVNY